MTLRAVGHHHPNKQTTLTCSTTTVKSTTTTRILDNVVIRKPLDDDIHKAFSRTQ